MTTKASPRIQAFVDALPLKPGMRVLEIGCGPGVAARLVAEKVGTRASGFVLATDRSETAIASAKKGSSAWMKRGVLGFRTVAVEDFELEVGEKKFDLVFAMRVGALDGRHPELEAEAMERLSRVLKPRGRVFIDGGHPRPLRELTRR